MTARAPLELERQVGRDVIRAGDVVKIVGLGRARTYVEDREVAGFRVLGFRGDEVECYGAKRRGLAPALRTFTVAMIRERVKIKR